MVTAYLYPGSSFTFNEDRLIVTISRQKCGLIVAGVLNGDRFPVHGDDGHIKRVTTLPDEQRTEKWQQFPEHFNALAHSSMNTTVRICGSSERASFSNSCETIGNTGYSARVPYMSTQRPDTSHRIGFKNKAISWPWLSTLYSILLCLHRAELKLNNVFARRVCVELAGGFQL